MKTISEPELALYAKSGSIEKLTLQLADQGGGYFLYADIKNVGVNFLLITQKKQPRIWSNADRLFAHIQKNYQPISNISVVLQNPTI